MTVHQCPECPLLFASRSELDGHQSSDHPHEPLTVPTEAIPVKRHRYNTPRPRDEKWEGFLSGTVGPPA